MRRDTLKQNRWIRDIAVFVSNEPSLLPRVIIAVTTDIIGKSREIKARYSDRKERGLKSDYT